MPRRMAEEPFRIYQWEHRYDEHIAPINRLVDELKQGERWLPYVAPLYGGVNARLLSVLRDPGPMTQQDVGSGFLCIENDDATAEFICNLFVDAGIDMSDVVPWNIYPWYINRKPQSAELEAGISPLIRLVDLLPGLRVVMLHGGDAHKGWDKLISRYPSFAEKKKLHVIKTYHTSRQAFWHPDPAVRDRRKKHLRDSFAKASKYLRL